MSIASLPFGPMAVLHYVYTYRLREASVAAALQGRVFERQHRRLRADAHRCMGHASPLVSLVQQLYQKVHQDLAILYLSLRE